jgi:hypothetical protein
MADKKESEGERLRHGTANARRSLIIIYGIGFVAIAIAIAIVMKRVPAAVNNGYGEPVPTENGDSRKLCQKFGDPCQFSPGKLGTCIEKQGCAGPGCLFCQSSH